MNNAMVLFRHYSGFETELEISLSFEVREMLKHLKEIYDIEMDDKARLQAEPIGRMLLDDQSLESQGIENGAVLTLVKL